MKNVGGSSGVVWPQAGNTGVLMIYTTVGTSHKSDAAASHVPLLDISPKIITFDRPTRAGE